MKLTRVRQNVLCSAGLSAYIQMPDADSFYDAPMGASAMLKSLTMVHIAAGKCFNVVCGRTCESLLRTTELCSRQKLHI